jgi:hypothetical protein
VNTNIYNKKNKGPALIELFTAIGKLYVLPLPCDFAELKAWITAAVKNIDAPMLKHCGKNLNIVSMCAVSPMVHTQNISSCQKNLFSFLVTVNDSIKVGYLVFLLKMLLIMENIMKCPIYSYAYKTNLTVDTKRKSSML